MLSDAELILGLSRHVGTYAASPAKAALEQLEFAGRVFELAWRLRGSGVSSVQRVAAIGIEAAVGPRGLFGEVLPALQTLGWLDIRKDDDGKPLAVDERIPAPGELIKLADQVLDVVHPTALERAALILLRETSRQPLTREAAMQACSETADDKVVEDALRHVVAIKLVREVVTDDGASVVFNPNIWVGDDEMAQAALKVEDANVRAAVGALIEEVAVEPGLPQDSVTSTEQRWIDFAVAHGLVQRSLVVTSEGKERAFLFTPHLTRDPFGVGQGDPSGHVRQLVGSMIYAATFARYKLEDPAAFIRRLIKDGEAGDASPIGTDYPMLETAGIVRVQPAERYFKLELLQPDIAERAVVFLEGRGRGPSMKAEGLRAQRSYRHLERERASIAHETPIDDEEAKRLISALRDVTARRTF